MRLGGIQVYKFDFIKLKLVDGKLKISISVDGFDGKYIARIIDNKLVATTNKFHLNVSDRYFELFDDYYIPILQIELIRKTNTIYIGGVFNRPDGYDIYSQNTIFTKDFLKSKFLMTQPKRDSLFNQYLIDTKMVKPISE